MVTQKQRRRGAHPGPEALDKDPKVDAEVVGVQEEVAGSSRPWDRMGEDTARLMREWPWALQRVAKGMGLPRVEEW